VERFTFILALAPAASPAFVWPDCQEHQEGGDGGALDADFQNFPYEVGIQINLRNSGLTATSATAPALALG
jgi:hypothetical protein